LEINGEPFPNETVSVPEGEALDLADASADPRLTATSPMQSAAVTPKRAQRLLCSLILFNKLLCILVSLR
jgi:hypothetical protein